MDKITFNLKKTLKSKKIETISGDSSTYYLNETTDGHFVINQDENALCIYLDYETAKHSYLHLIGELSDDDLDCIYEDEKKRESAAKAADSLNANRTLCDGIQEHDTKKEQISKQSDEEIIELPISVNYVQDWGLHEALRELFQNAIDRQKDEFDYSSEDNYDYSMIHDYYKKQRLFTIGSRNTSIGKKTLVLGGSEKADDSDKIGRFGEGYKLALIVLLRNGYQVEIRNQSELWIPEIKYSEKFGTDLLHITIKKIESKYPDLLFVVKGIKPSEYEAYKKFNLWLQKKPHADTTNLGDILYNDQYRGKIFVEGLYICTMEDSENFWYGYDFRANVLKLDRDRKKLSSFDVAWHSEKMLKELDPDNDDKIIEMLEADAEDVQYFIEHSWNGNENVQRIAETCYERFKRNYGDDVFPVGSSIKEDALKKEYVGIRVKHVPKSIAKACELTGQYTEDLLTQKKRIFKSPEVLLKEFMEENLEYFPQTLLDRFQEQILDKAKHWTGGEYTD